MGSIVNFSKKKLQPVNMYAYCPYCVKEAKEKGKDYKEVLQPVTLYTNYELHKNDDGSYKKLFFDYYYCDRCQRKLTVETYRLFYTCRADGTRWNERPLDERTDAGKPL